VWQGGESWVRTNDSGTCHWRYSPIEPFLSRSASYPRFTKFSSISHLAFSRCPEDCRWAKCMTPLPEQNMTRLSRFSNRCMARAYASDASCIIQLTLTRALDPNDGAVRVVICGIKGNVISLMGMHHTPSRGELDPDHGQLSLDRYSTVHSKGKKIASFQKNRGPLEDVLVQVILCSEFERKNWGSREPTRQSTRRECSNIFRSIQIPRRS
jgi:hypothetical protein